MTDQHSSRSKRLLGLGQRGVKSLIRDPVREAVREALAEERTKADERKERTRHSDTEDPESGNRLLRPAVLLPILGLVVVGLVVRRRGTTERNAPDEDAGTASTFDSTQPSTNDAEPADVADSNGYEDHDARQ